MADAPRPRPVEYYNPRPLILGICFFWGIAMGFCLFYFAPPKQMMGAGQNDGGQESPLIPTPMSERERRHLDTPDIAAVDPTPNAGQANRLKIDVMEMDPPTPVLTTEGGLTGRTAHILRMQQLQNPRPVSQPTTPRTRPSTMTTPPPIPELMP